MDLEKEIENLKGRVGALEGKMAQDKNQEYLELDLTLPEDDIGGLHFNEQKVHAVFEKQENGWFYARDILFLSARNIENDNSRDILTEYLNRGDIQAQISKAFDVSADDIEIEIPKKQQGKKRYNGVPMRYWLAYPSNDDTIGFNGVNSRGDVSPGNALDVGGCAPAFRVVRKR
jgi:hypothetical protein